MEKPSILIGTPTTDSGVVPEYVMSLVSTIQYLNGKASGGLMMYRCSIISSGRNAIAEKCNADYLMFIDSDIIFPPYGVMKLVERDKDIIGGVYYAKSTPNQPIVYTKNGNEKYEHINDLPKEPFECDGIGTGFLLIKKRVLEAFTPEVVRKLGKPFNMYQKKDGTEQGEDLAFCRRAKALGFSIWADPTIPLGHVGGEIYRSNHFKANLALKESYLKSLEYTNKIPGWMGAGELDWLYRQAKDKQTIVEVGSWKGKSTHALLSACKGTVWAIDHFKGSEGEAVAHAEAKDGKVYEEFMANVGHFENLQVRKMASLEAVKEFEDKSVEMVFIDGEHTYQGVKADIEAWLPKAKKLICGHDFNWLGVRQAVEETLGEVRTADTVWYKELI